MIMYYYPQSSGVRVERREFRELKGGVTPKKLVEKKQLYFPSGQVKAALDKSLASPWPFVKGFSEAGGRHL